MGDVKLAQADHADLGKDQNGHHCEHRLARHETRRKFVLPHLEDGLLEIYGSGGEGSGFGLRV